MYLYICFLHIVTMYLYICFLHIVTMYLYICFLCLSEDKRNANLTIFQFSHMSISSLDEYVLSFLFLRFIIRTIVFFWKFISYTDYYALTNLLGFRQTAGRKVFLIIIFLRCPISKNPLISFGRVVIPSSDIGVTYATIADKSLFRISFIQSFDNTELIIITFAF